MERADISEDLLTCKNGYFYRYWKKEKCTRIEVGFLFFIDVHPQVAIWKKLIRKENDNLILEVAKFIIGKKTK